MMIPTTNLRQRVFITAAALLMVLGITAILGIGLGAAIYALKIGVS
jgi:hypothetical protein